MEQDFKCQLDHTMQGSKTICPSLEGAWLGRNLHCLLNALPCQGWAHGQWSGTETCKLQWWLVIHMLSDLWNSWSVGIL